MPRTYSYNELREMGYTNDEIQQAYADRAKKARRDEILEAIANIQDREYLMKGIRPHSSGIGMVGPKLDHRSELRQLPKNTKDIPVMTVAERRLDNNLRDVGEFALDASDPVGTAAMWGIEKAWDPVTTGIEESVKYILNNRRPRRPISSSGSESTANVVEVPE
jgi:hypothetical protein